MSLSRPAILGIACGVVLWFALASVWPTKHIATAPPVGRVFSECDGQLKTLVMQYVADAGFVDETYRQFLTQLPPDVLVYLACPDQRTYDALLTRVGHVSCTLAPAITGHPITAWSRDRWVGLRGAAQTILLVPCGEQGAENWDARAGDGRVAFTLAGIFPGRAIAQSSPLYFDGGDVLADEHRASITPAVIRRNVQHTVADHDELLRQLSAALGRPAILLEDAPDHHAGMFMMTAGGGRMLVGDPSLGRKLWPQSPCWPEAPASWQPDFSPATQTRFDAVARQLEREGYQVTRIPTIPGTDGKAYITYTNVLIDQRPVGRVVYLPIYRGLDTLNRRAAEIWSHLGYTVIPIDCTQVFRYGGTLHCLVNVLEKR